MMAKRLDASWRMSSVASAEQSSPAAIAPPPSPFPCGREECLEVPEVGTESAFVRSRGPPTRFPLRR